MAKFIKKSGRKNPQIHRTYDNLSPAATQLARLDERLGVGIGAEKERKKLQRIIDGEK